MNVNLNKNNEITSRIRYLDVLDVQNRRFIGCLYINIVRLGKQAILSHYTFSKNGDDDVASSC